MNNYLGELGIHQRMISELAKVSTSTISRYIANNSIPHIEEGSQRNLRYGVESIRKVIKNVSSFSDKILKKKQAFYNFKGGTGKTSVCFQVASHVALIGYKVLVIDADPQAHLSVSLGITDDTKLTLYDLITHNQSLERVVLNIFEGLDCIPSNLSLTRLETELTNIPRREERLRIELENLNDRYDFIFIDTNPTISLLNRNVITYVDVLNIVCETQPYSLNGLKLLIEDLNQFFRHMDLKRRDLNIIPNKYEDRSTNSGEAMAVLKKYYAEYLKEDFAIRKSEDIVTSSKLGKPLAFFVRKNSNALTDIVDLIHYIISFSSR